MPVDILLDKERKIIRTHASGCITLEDFVGIMEKVIQLKDGGTISGDWGQIVDLTDVSSVEELSKNDITRMVAQNPWPSGARRAIVVMDDPVKELAILYQLLGSEQGQEIRLVETIDAAEEWISA